MTSSTKELIKETTMEVTSITPETKTAKTEEDTETTNGILVFVL